MAISYTEILSCPDIETLAVALHDALIAAGWTIIYADTDAIGTGSSGSPAWDKTPATITDAGRTIYEMTATTATSTRYVEILWRWGNPVSEWCPQVDIGTGHDGSGNLTGNLGRRGLTDLSGAIGGSDTWVTAHEDGFGVEVYDAQGWQFAVDHAWNLDGTVRDDLLIYFRSYSATNASYWTGISDYNRCARGSVVGLDTSGTLIPEHEALFLGAGGTSTTSLAPPNTMLAPDGTVGIPAGPYTMLAAGLVMLKSILAFGPSDNALGSTQAVTFDGTNRTYTIKRGYQFYTMYNTGFLSS